MMICSSQPPRKPMSVSLSCISSDGRIVHSFGYDDDKPFIFTHSLPLAGTTCTTSDEHCWEMSTLLPSHVKEALAVDEPLALICVESDSHPRSQSKNDSSKKLLPLICRYSA